MPMIHLIDGLDLKMADGPYNLHGQLLQPCYMDGESEECRVPLYLPQGSLDGACGIYSLLTAMTIAGAFEDADEQEAALSTGLAALAEKYPVGPLLTKGLNVTQLRTFLSGFSDDSGSWTLRKVPGDPGSIAQFRNLVEVLATSPVILMIPGHATVAIGWETYRSLESAIDNGTLSSQTRREVDRLLLMDPSQPMPASVYWNAVLTRANHHGPPRFHYSGARYSERLEIVTAYQLRRTARKATR